jgi:hypothetical protein
MISETVRAEDLEKLLTVFPDATVVEVPYDSANPFYCKGDTEERRAEKLATKWYYVTYAKGAVIRQYERNGYHDSDFYLVVYSAHTGTLYEWEYTSTRYGGSGIYGLGLHYTVDATPEVRETASAIRVAEAQRAEQESREADVEAMVALGASPESARLFVDKLSKFRGTPKYNGVHKLLCTKKFRSSFRQSLRDQVETWLRDPNPTYDFPLSPKQTSYITTDYRGVR